MTTIDISALTTRTPSGPMNINIHIETTLNVPAQIARQKVNSLILTEVGTGLGGEEPALVVEQQRILWRVPLILSLPFTGRLGQVGAIDVDARTGEIVTNPTMLKEIGDYAERLAASSGA